MPNEAFEGRGGGKPEMAQGFYEGSEEKIRDLIGIGFNRFVILSSQFKHNLAVDYIHRQR